LNADQIALGLKSIENNTISCPCFACGDANSDGTIDIADAVFLILFIFWGGAADAVFLILFIFWGGAAPGPCNYPFGMGDANGSASVDVGDAVYLISYIFAGGGTPHCA